MNYKEIYKQIIKTVGTQEGDIYKDAVIKNAINQGYMDLIEKEPQFSKAYVPVINGTAALPEDLLNIETITPGLTDEEYRKGNFIISNRTVTFEVLYSVVPEPLSGDNDVPALSNKAVYLLIDFACAKYFQSINELNTAQYFMNNYELGKKKLYKSDTIERNIIDVTGGW